MLDGVFLLFYLVYLICLLEDEAGTVGNRDNVDDKVENYVA